MSNDLPSLSPAAQALKPGLYEHFKGGQYRVIGVARNSENRDEEFVVYESLEKGVMWIRPLGMFIESVDRDGYVGPRFRYIGE